MKRYTVILVKGKRTLAQIVITLSNSTAGRWLVVLAEMLTISELEES